MTEFKRNNKMGGERVEVGCRLGGGVVRSLPNATAAAWRHARWRLPAIARALGLRKEGGRS